jgi:hypothetical protein
MNRYVVVPHHGDSRFRLSRHGRIVLFTTGGGPAAAALAGWSRLFGDRSAAEILQDMEQVTAHNPALGAFVLAVLDDDAVEVALSGGLPLAAHGPNGIEVIQSTDGLTRRRLGGVSVVAVTVQGAVVDSLLELERGTIAADGFEIHITQPAAGASPWAAPVAAAPVAPEGQAEPTGSVPETPAPPAAAVVSLHAAHDELPEAEPLPVASAAPPAAPSPPAAPGEPHAIEVQGLQCGRGHFNDPRARFCGLCGIAMHQASFVLVSGVRPPLGVLVFGDGSVHTLAVTSIVGRDPSDEPAVRRGDAVALALHDPTNTLSRVHAELRLVDWDVQVVDRGSTNGTFVWSSGQTSWERLAPDAPRTLQPGTHVSFGRLTATFESSLRPS